MALVRLNPGVEVISPDGSVSQLRALSQAAYDGLGSKDGTTLYIVRSSPPAGLFDGTLLGDGTQSATSASPYSATCSDVTTDNGFGSYCTIGPAAVSGHGAANVADPLGGITGRNIIKTNTLESEAGGNNTGEVVVRSQLLSGTILSPGSDYWVVQEVMHTGIPSVPDWMSLMSVYGPGASAAGRLTISVRGTSLTWVDEGVSGSVIWSTPFTVNVWHVIARRIKLSSSPSAADGTHQLYYATRGHPLALQTLTGPQAGVTTRTWANAAISGNHWSSIGNYHAPSMSGWSGSNGIYYGTHRVYAASAVPSLASIDPYYVGE